jgi:hypothetical protein
VADFVTKQGDDGLPFAEYLTWGNGASADEGTEDGGGKPLAALPYHCMAMLQPSRRAPLAS